MVDDWSGDNETNVLSVLVLERLEGYANALALQACSGQGL
jgi:hypothetical protein